MIFNRNTQLWALSEKSRFKALLQEVTTGSPSNRQVGQATFLADFLHAMWIDVQTIANSGSYSRAEWHLRLIAVLDLGADYGHD